MLSIPLDTDCQNPPLGLTIFSEAKLIDLAAGVINLKSMQKIIAISAYPEPAWCVIENGRAVAEPLQLIGEDLNINALAHALRPEHGTGTTVYVEAIRLGRGEAPATVFRKGKAIGGVLALLQALGIPHEVIGTYNVTREMHRDMPKELSDQGKSHTKAVQLEPLVQFVLPGGRRPHRGMIDAVLLAHYAKRKLAGQVREDEFAIKEQGDKVKRRVQYAEQKAAQSSGKTSSRASPKN